MGGSWKMALRRRRYGAAAVTILAGAILGAVVLLACGRTAPRDIVVITLDTFRAELMGAYGNASGLTPALDALARRSVVFESASAAAPITLPSHASLFTGRYPTATGVRNNGTFVLPASETTLAEILKAAGWRTGAVIAAHPLESRYGIAQGFDLYDEDISDPRAAAGPALPIFYGERDARRVTDRALDVWGRLSGGPRFLWVHYFDTHAPYAAPEPWFSRHAGRPYEAEAAFVDEQVGRLLARIGVEAPDAVVCVVADHGESLGEHGEKTHGVFVYDATIHVPFLLRAPGRLPAGVRVAAPVSLVDVLPTILALARVAAPPGIAGADLAGLVSGGKPPSRPIYAESYLPRLQFRFSELTMLRLGALKYIDAPSPEIYDLLQDPGETRNLHGGQPQEQRLAEALAAFRESADPAAASRAKGALDSESEAKLRSLGYTSAGVIERRPGEGRGRDPKTMTDYLHRYDLAVSLAAAKPEEGIALLRELVPEAPENFMARYQLGAALMRAGQLVLARDELAQVVTAAPGFSNGHLMLAKVESLLGNVDEAIPHFEAAAKLAPDFAEPRFALGRLLETLGRFDAAAAAYLAALSVEPNDREAARRLIELRAGHGTLPQAAADLRALLAERPHSASLWTALGQTLQRRGDAAGAVDAYRRAIEINADDAAAMEGLRRLHAP
jgi:arylsulfatase A-like enzyme/Flp pilus assembly protein TadD